MRAASTFDGVDGALQRLAAGGGAAQEAAVFLARVAVDDGQAAERMAVLAAAGSCRPQSWDDAIGFLRQSAALGYAPARQQLEILGGDAFDLRWWLAPPPKQPLSDLPRIRRFEAFLPAQICDWLIVRAQPKLQPARVYGRDGGAEFQQTRTNREMDFNIVDSDVVVLLVRARIAAATGLPPTVMELTKVLHYRPDERFDPHFDFLDPANPAMSAEIQQRGQRLATLLVYLNDDYAGGETHFLQSGLKFRGRKGDALMFANVDLQNRPDPRTLHAGLPPTRGEKWLLSQWIRDRPQPG